MSALALMTPIALATAPIGIGYLAAKWCIAIRAIGKQTFTTLFANFIVILLGAKFTEALTNASTVLEILFTSIICVSIVLVMNMLGIGAWLLIASARKNRHKKNSATSIFESNTKKWMELLSRFQPLAALILGALLGKLLSPSSQLIESLISFSLFGLLFSIGITIHQQGSRLRDLACFSGVITALIVLVTSGIASVLIDRLLDISLIDSLAVSSGFGWASYSGLTISLAAGPKIGAIAFFCDLLRSMAVIILAPLFRNASPHYLVGTSGGTAMDVSLSTIQITHGPSSLPVAITAGFILTIATPIILTMLYW